MKMIGAYIKDYQSKYVLAGICFLLFNGIGYLYYVSLEYLIYASMLYLFCICLDFIIYFIKYRHLYRKLQYIKNTTLLQLEDLPRLSSMVQLYVDIIQHEYEQKQTLALEHQQDRQHILDYYTLWVHQIKTPIAAMHVLLEQDNVPMSVMETELFKIEQYANLALDYIRLNSQTNDFVIEKFSIDVLIKQVMKKYALLFIQKKINLDYQKSDLVIKSDKKWLALVIEQLVSNAIKYTHERGNITIYTTSQSLYIQDNGIGILKEDMARIFERGYTGYNGRRLQQSSGLGLYICKSITHKLGQQLSLESTVGCGTCAIITFDKYSLDV
ncbi:MULTISPECIES: HAMP domain-containing sensor histidine kinase [unclassified Granulicatella]|uniref:sensor histidine kinase n=1 Tax=unclassified Granulicatella TaxID=2630493 RepID=UPI0010744B2B|nr:MULTISPECIES: sensor histidine kinase [unclassified Granulicatella]MBF0779597.1 sensor histidine kinase [Granulicatella sp. 19428wC4_WM01]TFU96397.1 HAMP domain-containing histidine kinase [Granulicatella sp. WM01]